MFLKFATVTYDSRNFKKIRYLYEILTLKRIIPGNASRLMQVDLFKEKKKKNDATTFLEKLARRRKKALFIFPRACVTINKDACLEYTKRMFLLKKKSQPRTNKQALIANIFSQSADYCLNKFRMPERICILSIGLEYKIRTVQNWRRINIWRVLFLKIGSIVWRTCVCVLLLQREQLADSLIVYRCGGSASPIVNPAGSRFNR